MTINAAKHSMAMSITSHLWILSYRVIFYFHALAIRQFDYGKYRLGTAKEHMLGMKAG